MAYFSSSNYEQYYDNNYQFYQPYYNADCDPHVKEMAYFSSSNDEQYYDNYQFYQPYYNAGYNTPHESRYVQSYTNEYQLAPSQSLVGYYYSNNNNIESKNANLYENGEYYYDPVKTQFVISYNNIGGNNNNNNNNKANNDLDFEEYNPEPFHGGYDISQTYGQALPPSLDICYPPTKIDPNFNISLPYGKEVDQKLVGQVNPETNLVGSGGDEDEDDEEDDDNEDDEKQEISQNLILEENVINSEEDEDKDEDEEDKENEDNNEVDQKLVGQVNTETNLVGSGGDEDEDDEEDYDEEEDEEDDDNEDDEKQEIVILEENVINSEEDEEEDEEDKENEDNNDGKEVKMQTLEGEEKNIRSEMDDNESENRGNERRRQITAGYGMEAIDICEGLFGGYFPCLLKKNRGGCCNKQCDGSGVKLRNMDEYDCWQGTVDYFFGNPNPYGGSMPEKGSYGDPMFCYQRYFPQESIVGEVKEMKYEENEKSSWLLNDYSRVNYGYNQ